MEVAIIIAVVLFLVIDFIVLYYKTAHSLGEDLGVSKKIQIVLQHYFCYLIILKKMTNEEARKLYEFIFKYAADITARMSSVDILTLEKVKYELEKTVNEDYIEYEKIC